MKLGYLGDTLKYDLSIQLEFLKREDCDQYFKQEGRSFHKESALEVLMDMILPGDIVVVSELEIFDCTTNCLIKILNEFRIKQVEFISVREEINTTTSFGKSFYISIKTLSNINKSENNLKPSLTKGNKRGRPLGLSQEKIKIAEMAKKLYYLRMVPEEEICKMLNISRATFFRYLKLGDSICNN